MEIAIDLHIHSALSPCAEDDMTPNNIVNMALLKRLDAISITDHNGCDNIEAVIKAADDRIIVVPGIEVQTREEVHLLCYFNEVDKLLDFEDIIKDKLPNIKNDPKVIGNQLIIDEKDEIVGERQYMLISSIDMSLDQVLDEVQKREGAVVPAHIDRSSYSIISQLGFIPENLGIGMLEISQNNNKHFMDLPNDRMLFSSDAHYLWQILERESFLTVDHLSISQIVNTLKHSR
ncbi:MAG: PHP domain-containing protein [Clostridiales bacterium]|nr:PHP domain-containing protein [Clostridiales bacterium]